jgi:23S rRNA (uracil1939-C5)-methyltransferase
LKKGDILDLDIKKYAFEGKGIAKVNKNLIVPSKENEDGENNYVVFVHGSYPGDKVKAKLIKIKKSYAEAQAVEILSPSSYRAAARCEYFGTCGGCKQQDMDYTAQAQFKQLQVEETFRNMGGFKDLKPEPVISAEQVYYYRNKMEFSFADKRWITEEEIKNGAKINRDFALGLHIPGMFDKVLDIDKCYLQSELSNRILNFTRSFFKSRNTTIYSSKTNEGYLRNLVVRQALHTGDVMVNLVTFYEDDGLMKQYTSELLNAVPEITTVINNINLKKALIAAGDYEKVYYGPGYIYDNIGSYRYRISANSFFQTNTLQAVKLYQAAAEYAEFKGNEVVYDLYSGAGTISIFVSGMVKEVYAIEAVESAVKDAEENLLLNNINNVKFIPADLYKTFLPVVEEKQIPLPDVIILDPPRGGMHPNTVEDILQLAPPKIVYVSCNPATQVRDIKLLTAEKYRLVKMKPVDMFPHTYHIENVALLERV